MFSLKSRKPSERKQAIHANQPIFPKSRAKFSQILLLHAHQEGEILGMKAVTCQLNEQFSSGHAPSESIVH